MKEKYTFNYLLYDCNANPEKKNVWQLSNEL